MPIRTFRRGEEWVVAQALLGAAVVLVATLAPGRGNAGAIRLTVGIALLVIGLIVAVASARALGRALTPLPSPRPGAPLSRRGPYRVVRHPIYTGLILLAAGASLVGSGWALVPALALAVFLDRKATKEEEWLVQTHPEYDALRAAVRWRFLPGVR
jgi:protein-S-isoprenylcysteine O-methyltransferase Ste14